MKIQHAVANLNIKIIKYLKILVFLHNTAHDVLPIAMKIQHAGLIFIENRNLEANDVVY